MIESVPLLLPVCVCDALDVALRVLSWLPVCVLLELCDCDVVCVPLGDCV